MRKRCFLSHARQLAPDLDAAAMSDPLQAGTAASNLLSRTGHADDDGLHHPRADDVDVADALKGNGRPNRDRRRPAPARQWRSIGRAPSAGAAAPPPIGRSCRGRPSR